MPYADPKTGKWTGKFCMPALRQFVNSRKGEGSTDGGSGGQRASESGNESKEAKAAVPDRQSEYKRILEEEQRSRANVGLE